MSFAVLAAALLAAPPTPALQPVGGEQKVNVYVSSAQQTSTLAADANGGVFVVWAGRGEGDPNGIYGRRFDAANVALGGEFAVNSLVSSAVQSQPRIVRLTTGGYVVAWTSAGQDGDRDGVIFRRFDANGSPLAADSVANATTTGAQSLSDLTQLPNGGFVVAYTADDAENAGTFVRRFGANGVALGGAVQANTTTTELQNGAAVGSAPDGSFVVVWQSVGGFGSGADLDGSGGGIFAQRFDAAGAKVGAEFRINSITEGDQVAPDVAVQTDGSFQVVWQGPEADGEGTGIFGRHFAADGTPTGEDVKLSSYGPGDQRAAQVVALATGGYLAVWSSFGQDGDNEGVVARELSASGLPVAGEAVVNQTTATAQYEPAVAATGNGGFVVSWTSKQIALNGNDVYLRRFAGGGCNPDSTTLCLNNSRFSVQVGWEKPDGAVGEGQGVALTNDTGYYWFFTSANVEMVLKVLNACGVNGNYWVFAGGLTNVETDILVTDTQTGAVRTYQNPQRTPFAPIQDILAFPCSGGSLAPQADPVTVAALAAAEHDALMALVGHPDAGDGAARDTAPDAATACSTDADTLCLNNSRFTVEVEWENQQGASGIGQAVPLTGDTGFFWFFRASNVELVVKVLSACGVNQKYWVFAGGLTNVKTTIRVNDTTTGEEKVYENPLGTQFAPLQDTNAFACAPPPAG
jgi:hypothetical protein